MEGKDMKRKTRRGIRTGQRERRVGEIGSRLKGCKSCSSDQLSYTYIYLFFLGLSFLLNQSIFSSSSPSSIFFLNIRLLLILHLIPVLLLLFLLLLFPHLLRLAVSYFRHAAIFDCM